MGIGLAILVYGFVGDTIYYDPEAGKTYKEVLPLPIVLGVAMIAYSLFRKKDGND